MTGGTPLLPPSHPSREAAFSSWACASKIKPENGALRGGLQGAAGSDHRGLREMLIGREFRLKGKKDTAAGNELNKNFHLQNESLT